MDHQKHRAIVYTLLIVVTLAQCAGISLLHRQASSSSQAAASLLRVQVLANRLDALEWRAISLGKVQPDLQTELADTRRQVASLLSGLGVEDGNAGLAEVRQAYETYRLATDQELSYLNQGDIAQARAVDQAQVDPGFERLALSIATSGNALVARSERWRRLALGGIILSVLLAASVIAMLFRQSEKVEEKARLDLMASNRRLAESQLRVERAHQGLQRQAEQMEVLNGIDQAILAAHLPDETAHAATGHIRRLVPCDRAGVILFDFEAQTVRWLAVDGSGTGQIGLGACLPLQDARCLEECRSGEAVSVEDLEALAAPSVIERAMLAEGMRSYLSIPLRAEQRVLGALNLWRARPGAFAPEEGEVARRVADSLAVALFHGELYQQVQADRNLLQALNHKLVEVQEEERRAIARELHDESGQALTSLAIGLGLLEQELDDPMRAAMRVSSLKQVANDVVDSLHRLAMDLRPPSLDRLGLVPALRQYVDTLARERKLTVELTTAGLDMRLPAAIETALYRIVQEALTNVSRHALATRAGVILHWREPDGNQGGQIVAIVEDDGIGFDPSEAAARGRLGLAGMRERAEALDGRLTVETAPGQGTAIIVEVPCECTHPDC